ncbi:flagellar type III secretion system pore protein FliP [Uliginosibacterium sp. H3]|uniref:Flagellar biosynthetic protein FliP n=1 Tax=Uliginosibacterium silvisoli TaxID=3114758 RepID=A0ABU6K5C8_9RHOO|nr:flagellar type III secretion system pore protein FliP [Uliginosibacterium sp. H3]MEC5386935.1 flagellar type III secretion system pore protein FliP [Uliginosibacterium sp. H3]
MQVKSLTRSRSFALLGSLLCLASALPLDAFAQGIPALTSTPAAGGGTTYSLQVQTLLLMTALTFIPAVVLMMSGFTRIVIVMSMLRHAMGTQTSPPNQVIVGLSLFLTFFVMSPVIDKVYTEAWVPMSTNQIQFDEALTRASVPVKAFMLKQMRDSDLTLFAKLAKVPKVEKAADLPMRVIVPAFVTSELKTAFQIAFIIFLPFLVIDMVVASVLMSMGMMMMSPVIVSLPFKIMLFVLVDGWNLVIASLIRSFG